MDDKPDENQQRAIGKRVAVLTLAAVACILLMIGAAILVSIVWFRLHAG
jgi:hypothetical protein